MDLHIHSNQIPYGFTYSFHNQKLGLKIDTKELCQGIPNSAGKKEEEVLKLWVALT